MMGIGNFFKRKDDAYKGLLGLSVGECPYTVVDTELTGLDRGKDSIVSIGCVRMKGSIIDIGKTFYRLVKPSSALTAESIMVHGITPSEVEEKPVIDKVIVEFLEFCGNTLLVGHFFRLDLLFLNKEHKRIFGRGIGNPSIDTCSIYEWIGEHGEGPRRNGNQDLFSIARKYNVPVQEAHNALTDAYITAQLFQKFLCLLPALGVKTVKDLLSIGRL